MFFVEYEVMRLHRFYIDKPLGEEIVVENVNGGKELIHQWTRVFRYTSGDEVFLFSKFSPGNDFLYRLSSVSREKIILSFVSISANTLPTPMTLVMALVKKDTFETIARSATELGITRIIPLVSARSEKKNLNRERILSIVIEASEQAGRGSIPEVAEITTFKDAMGLTRNCQNIMGSLRAGQGSNAVKGLDFSKELALWVGPEGGWTEEEENLAHTEGIKTFKFTDTVLKADTGAIALLAWLKGVSTVDSLI